MPCNAISTYRVTSTSDQTIAGLLRAIDKMQRDAVANNAKSRCDNCILSPIYNTKPIALYCCNNRFEFPVGLTEDTADLFRVEEVRGNDTVVLRLLTRVGETITCTTYTVVVDISCICAVQCYDPINCAITCGVIV